MWVGEIEPSTATMVSPQPELTSTSTGKASMPLTAADKTRASVGGVWGKEGTRLLSAYHAFYGFTDASELVRFQPADLSRHEAGMGRE
jgi:hypothetical protein